MSTEPTTSDGPNRGEPAAEQFVRKGFENWHETRAILNDPERAAILVGALVAGLADSQRGCATLVGLVREIHGHLGTIARRLNDIDAKLAGQDALNKVIAETFTQKLEPRLKALEARPGLGRIEAGMN
jgi:ribosomal protein L35AE/L33A